MLSISVIGTSRSRSDDLTRQLEDHFKIEFQPLSAALDGAPHIHTLIDIDLRNEPQLVPLKEWLKEKPEDAKIVFVTDKASRLQDMRAYALGATAVVHRPINGGVLLNTLCGEDTTVASVDATPDQQTPGVAAAVDGLEGMFSAACTGAPVDATAVQAASDAVVSEIEAQGLSDWIATVRAHHSQTYQHCLLVTGLAVGFGQHIGVSRKDRQRLSFAGMLHDIGKARIPLAILEKPARLDDDELAIMRKHPEYGLDALASATSLHPEMLDMVVHHHELLDGSGYPHGLSGSEIADLVRMMTISDIFGALIERRSYKAPLSGPAAYQILLDMGPQLDKDLVRAFKFASHLSAV